MQGSAFVVYFMDHAPRDWHDLAFHHDAEMDVTFRRILIDEGIYFFPVATKQCSISAAHSDEDVDRTIEAAKKALRVIGTASKAVSRSQNFRSVHDQVSRSGFCDQSAGAEWPRFSDHKTSPNCALQRLQTLHPLLSTPLKTLILRPVTEQLHPPSPYANNSHWYNNSGRPFSKTAAREFIGSGVDIVVRYITRAGVRLGIRNHLFETIVDLMQGESKDGENRDRQPLQKAE